MPRPIKKNADYFPHDKDMRDDPKMKAVRGRFGLEGYAVYNMLLEILTDAEDFKIFWSDLDVEIIAGDVGISSERLIEIVDFQVKLNLFQKKIIDVDNVILLSYRHRERFSGLLSKRKRQRDRDIDSENTQSKVKKSKVNTNSNDQYLQGSKKTIAKATAKQEACIKSICDYWQIRESVDVHYYRHVYNFVLSVDVDHLKNALNKYIELKGDSRFKHAIKNWAGSAEEDYKDGYWYTIAVDKRAANYEDTHKSYEEILEEEQRRARELGLD